MARFITQGFLQVSGVNFGDTYALITLGSTFRVVLRLTANGGYEICQLDAKTAFLQSEVEGVL